MYTGVHNVKQKKKKNQLKKKSPFLLFVLATELYKMRGIFFICLNQTCRLERTYKI